MNPSEPIRETGSALDKLFTSDEERLTRKEALERLRQQPDIMQMEVNKQEAKHPSIFVAGARPAAMWLFLIIMVNSYIIAPYFEAITGLDIPNFPLDFINTALFGLLGLSGLRTFEKTKGIERQ
jgi:hypothetical protein